MVWRWHVGGNGLDNKVYLRVQALPCKLDLVKSNPALRLDNTRAIVVTEFMLGYSAFKNLPGPVPMFFSDDPTVTLHELRKTPRFAFDCMQMLVARLLETEQLTMEQAGEYLKNPTIGRTKTPLVRTWESVAGESSGSSAKKDKGKCKQSTANIG